jgi:chromosome segregation protein
LRLKSIEIHGFKSFPDRVRLDFNDGITAIIGPNGSGKSNIADAVRWVLGEQSTRTLRGGKMEDVIFGGTQARKPQGVASVTLVIENSDRALDCDSDEVSIMRRLYRSGDSEYRINGALVRLKDVNELLMDTGLGRDGYSIIGQGRISEIVSAKSAQRREIFEEAAGISKYRYRKTEAERRLEMAQENHLRLLDILSELSARLAPLKEQSEKAQRFLALSADKKILEVSIWMRALGVLRRKAAVLEDKLLLAQQDHSDAVRSAEELETAFISETERGRSLLEETERRRAEAATAIQQAGALEAQSGLLQNDISHHERAIEEAEAAIAQSGRSQEEILADLKTADETIVRLSEQTAAFKSQAQEIEAQIAASQESQEAQSAQVDALRLRRTVVFEAIEAAKLEAATSTTLLEEGNRRLQGMEKALNEPADALEELEREHAQCAGLLEEISRGMASIENAMQGYQLKRASRQKKLDEVSAVVAQLTRQAQECEQRAKLLSDMEKIWKASAPA